MPLGGASSSAPGAALQGSRGAQVARCWCPEHPRGCLLGACSYEPTPPPPTYLRVSGLVAFIHSFIHLGG